jgi:hypothetical protein
MFSKTLSQSDGDQMTKMSRMRTQRERVRHTAFLAELEARVNERLVIAEIDTSLDRHPGGIHE